MSIHKMAINNKLIYEGVQNIPEQLRRHAYQIQQRQKNQMIQKLQIQYNKDRRAKEIQGNFIKWTLQKSQQNQVKFQKAQKNKQEHIAKIIKKCKIRDKYLIKKQEDFLKTRKKSLNIAWKKAQKYNEDLAKYHQSKFMSKTVKNSEHFYSLQKSDCENNAQVRDKIQQQKNKNQIKVNKNSPVDQNKIYDNNSHYFMIDVRNSTKLYNIQRQKQLIQQRKRLDRVQSAGIDTRNSKSLQIAQRASILNKNFEDSKIQEICQKMQKIYQSRVRRQKIYDTKQNMQQREREVNLSDEKKPQPKHKPKQKKQQRVHSEQCYKRDLKTNDRIMQSKIKRQQMLQQHISQGNDYLENIKVRHLKTVIQKNIAYNAIEKKLYIQRLNN